MAKYNTNEEYVQIARQILDIKNDFDLTLITDELLYEVFQVYADLGFDVEKPHRDKDSEFIMTYDILLAGLGVERYKDWDEYNIFKD